MAIQGSVTLSGVDDKVLALALTFKAAHEGVFTFNPQQMQQMTITEGHGKPQRPGYAGMTFTWGNPQGLKAVIELLQKIEGQDKVG